MNMAYQQSGDPGQPGPTGAPAHGSPPPPPPPDSGGSRRNWLLIAGILVIGMVLLVGMVMVIVAVAGLASGGEMAFSAGGQKVGVITVEGVISAAGQQSFLGEPLGGVRQTLKQLKRAEEDDGIAAIVLRINSPGGSAAASQELYYEIQRVAESKPVVASMADVAASGGYYIALPAERIIANQATMTGSIGVRMSFLRYYELMDEIGVDGGSITSGEYKDIGSPWREMRSDERELLEGMIDNIYDQFVEHVAESREMEETDARKLADGRIFTGEQALEAGLIDELGGFNDAVKVAGELGGIEGEPEVRDIGGGSSLFDLMGAQSRAIARDAAREAVENALRDLRVEDVEQVLQMPR
ncbi:MAG: signal peptide peptidase SppA [Armatimonadia bacterium]|nr:signal peptide peptidase SppA [Armatimonadia bacterium]